MWCGSNWYLHRGDFSGFGSTGSECEAGERGAGRWRRGALSVTKFILVRHSGYCRSVVRICVRSHEYGQSNWGGDHCFADALDCPAFWLDRLIYDGCGAMSDWSRQLAGCRSDEERGLDGSGGCTGCQSSRLSSGSKALIRMCLRKRSTEYQAATLACPSLVKAFCRTGLKSEAEALSR